MDFRLKFILLKVWIEIKKANICKEEANLFVANNKYLYFVVHFTLLLLLLYIYVLRINTRQILSSNDNKNSIVNNRQRMEVFLHFYSLVLSSFFSYKLQFYIHQLWKHCKLLYLTVKLNNNNKWAAITLQLLQKHVTSFWMSSLSWVE